VNIKYRLVGLKKLQEATHQAPGVLATRNAEAMQRSVALVRGIVVADTPTGPGHFGMHLVDRFSTRVRFGTKRIVGVISTDAPQGRWRERGTRAHDIAPRKGNALKVGSGFAMVVHHPGAKARHTMKKAFAASKGAIKVFFIDAARGVAQSMATSGD
jgi:hypothetical protein